MINRKQVEDIKERVKSREISDELGQKIKDAWDKLPLWRKVPTPNNQTRFFRRLNLTPEQQKELRGVIF